MTNVMSKNRNTKKRALARHAMRIPHEKVILASLREAELNYDWLGKNFPRLRSQIDGCYVIVWKQSLVAYDPNLAAARRIARKKKVPLAEALVDYVPSRGETWVY